MHAVLAMAKKDLTLVARDWLGLFFIIAFPVLMGIFFGSMYSGIGERGRGAGIEIALVDEDDTAESSQFIQALKDTELVSIDKTSRDRALDQVRRGRAAAMIGLPKGFGRSAGIPWVDGPAVEIGADPGRQAEAGMIEGLVMQAAGKMTIERFQPMVSGFLDLLGVDRASPSTPGDSVEGEASPSAPSFQLVRIKKIDVTHRPAPGSAEALVANIRSRWDISFPQAMMWGVLGCAAAFAISIVRERKQGTLLRLSAAPIAKGEILCGKALACFLAVLLVIAMMVALGVWLGMRPRSPALLVLAAFCIAVAFVGISILMSVIGRTEEAVSGAAWGLNTLMAMFGGGMIPLAFMPKFMASLSQASPVKWSILALEGAIWRGFSLAEMMLPCAILVGVGVVCLVLGSMRLARMVD